MGHQLLPFVIPRCVFYIYAFSEPDAVVGRVRIMEQAESYNWKPGENSEFCLTVGYASVLHQMQPPEGRRMCEGPEEL